MTQTLKCYAFDDHLVRVILRGEDPWFVLVDVCRILGLKNPAMVAQALDQDEKGISSTDTLGGEQDLLIVSESGLYTIILRSRAATTPGSPAHRFRKWVTAEVLPQIRKTGGYSAPQEDGEHGRGPSSTAEDRNRLDKIHYCLKLYGPPAARALWRALGLEWVPEMEQGNVTPASADMNVAEFASTRLLKRPGVVTAAQVLYHAYKEWCGERAVIPLSDSSFGRMMVKLGYEKTKSNRIYYRNVIVKPEAEQERDGA
jgi:prophage antirepressor-like protein